MMRNKSEVDRVLELFEMDLRRNSENTFCAKTLGDRQHLGRLGKRSNIPAVELLDTGQKMPRTLMINKTKKKNTS